MYDILSAMRSARTGHFPLIWKATGSSFDSPHAAISAAVLPAQTVVMPTLRSITASCGMSLRLRDEAIEQAKGILRASNIDPALYRLYRVEQEGKKRGARKLNTKSEFDIPQRVFRFLDDLGRYLISSSIHELETKSANKQKRCIYYFNFHNLYLCFIFLFNFFIDLF